MDDALADGRPSRIAIDPDDYHAEHVGHTADGRQFFLTAQFDPALGDHAGSEYLALYLFDAAGVLIEARIEDFGPRAKVDEEKIAQLHANWLKGLGRVKCKRITIAPFAVQRYGLDFGLIASQSEDGDWSVELQPGNFMAFFEPWDSGVYDT